MIDTKEIREKLPEFTCPIDVVRALCNEVDRLMEELENFKQQYQEQYNHGVRLQAKLAACEGERLHWRGEVERLQKSPQPPIRVGKIIDEQEKEIAELKVELETTYKVIRSSDEVRAQQARKIFELKGKADKWRLCVSYNRELSDRNTKLGREIVELKRKLLNTCNHTNRVIDEQEKEIAGLKTELRRWRFSADHLKARQKLIEVIEKVLDRQHYRSWEVVQLEEALEKYGMK